MKIVGRRLIALSAFGGEISKSSAGRKTGDTQVARETQSAVASSPASSIMTVKCAGMTQAKVSPLVRFFKMTPLVMVCHQSARIKTY